jgi:hypothetical protein
MKEDHKYRLEPFPFRWNRLVPDREFAECEIATDNDGKARRDQQCAFHSVT